MPLSKRTRRRAVLARYRVVRVENPNTSQRIDTMSEQTVPQHQVDWPGGSPSVRQADGDATTAGRESTVKALGGGSMAEAVAGLGAGVLAIIGLVGTAPERLGAIAAIVIGAGLLARGAAVAARTSSLANGNAERNEVASGLSVEVMAGIAGIALGILAFLSIERAVLIPIALMAFGAALMLGAAVTRQVDNAAGGLSDHSSAAIDADLGAEVLTGLGAGVLGILAIVGGGQDTALYLVGLLAVGAAMLLEAAPGLLRLGGIVAR